ncbi:hypothetical protein RUM44_013584 [Polyplax serrata]|uniref:Cytochrome P450 n=1 Tax=Polyplax serrata TaxID=468196 RepID=A0ABR1BEL0_POLSC
MFDLGTIVLFLGLTILFYIFANNNNNYWKDRNVPFIPPLPLLGNLKPLIFMEKSMGDFMADLHNSVYAAGQKFVGIYMFRNEPAILVRDPELVKHILIKDFEHFTDRNVVCDEKRDPIGFNIMFNLEGQKWKFVRTKLSPTFTAGKMKQMFTIVKEKANGLLNFLDQKVEKDKNSDKHSAIIESKSVMAKFTVDVISSCAFGINVNSFSEMKSEFSDLASNIFHTSLRRAIDWRAIFFIHSLVKLFKCNLVGKEGNAFFTKVFRDTLEERENRKIFRNDFMDMLINLKNEQAEKLRNKTEGYEQEIYKFDGDLLLAQSMVFFVAGFETNSTTISMALYELAIQPHIQNKLRAEILENMKSNGGELTYDGISEMKYLGMVVSETLRKYPPLPFLGRTCTKDYKLPGTDVTIKKGTQVLISLFKGLHYDPEQFPMPEHFNPERFSPENKGSIHPCANIPFGEGPRICIGMRFGYMAVKTGLSLILSRFKIELCEETPIPLEIENRALMLTVKGGNNLKFVKL